MTPIALVSVVLLVYSTAVCAYEENDLVVLTTASRLREEIRSELNQAGDFLLTKISQFFIPGYTPSHPACSCKEILQLAPQSPSGLYWISGTNNKPKHMYCDMERSCKGVAGGWMRVASIDMTKTGSTCPSGLRTLTSPRRLCAKNIDGGGCSSVVLPVQGVEYSRVCGKIIGYQQGTTDGFRPTISENIDSNYVDGISLTHGKGPRQHIWTFVAALHEYNSHTRYVCPCTNTRNTPPPPVPGFIGYDYFCDTGCANHYQFIFYGDDPLWDGAGCGPFNTCCSWNYPPWFRKEISPPTSDDIEMRLCFDEGDSNENVYIRSLEIYVM